MGAALQLERFDPPSPAPRPALHSAEELQDAYLHGVIAGREQAVAEQAGQIQAALTAMSAELADLHAALAEAGRARYLALFNETIVAGYVVDVAFGTHDPAKYEWPTLIS